MFSAHLRGYSLSKLNVNLKIVYYQTYSLALHRLSEIRYVASRLRLGRIICCYNIEANRLDECSQPAHADDIHC